MTHTHDEISLDEVIDKAVDIHNPFISSTGHEFEKIRCDICNEVYDTGTTKVDPAGRLLVIKDCGIFYICRGCVTNICTDRILELAKEIGKEGTGDGTDESVRADDEMVCGTGRSDSGTGSVVHDDEHIEGEPADTERDIR